MSSSIHFLGAAGTVTGSRHLLDIDGKRVLVDCGLFQGLKQLRLRNWAPFEVSPRDIDAVVLTHAHIDHSGYLPLLVKNGFRGQVHCTKATFDLCGILLPDSGFLQEKDAERANRYGYTKHKPARPLYTEADAEACLDAFRVHPFDSPFEILPGVEATFRHAGHILGAAIAEVTADRRKIVFSGDLGRYDSPIMPDPAPVRSADVLVMESTYGDRLHRTEDPEEEIAGLIRATAARSGTLLMPSFAVGRAQTLLFHLARLKRAGRIPDIPVFLDSPMAQDATDLFRQNHRDHKLSASECHEVFAHARYVRTAEDSQALNANPMPKVIISASGMATGGRVLHHLKFYAPDDRNMILFAGFQAAGTRGASLVEGATQVKIHGAYIPVNAEVRNLDMLSAHADQADLLRWLSGFSEPPARTFIVHGEPHASEALRVRILDELGWQAETPILFQKTAL